MISRVYLVLLGLLLLIQLPVLSCSGSLLGNGAGIAGLSCGRPFIGGGNLNFEGSPELGKPVEMVYSVESSYIGENISLEVVLPEGFKLRSGDLRRSVPVPDNGMVGIRAMVAAEIPGDWIITAWAGPAAEPRLSGDVLFVSVSKEKCLTGKIPLSLSAVAEGKENPRQEYLIAFRENNPRYKTIVLSFPGIDFLTDTSYGDQNKPAIRVTAAKDQISTIRQLDFVVTAYPAPSGAAQGAAETNMPVRNILISAALIIVSAVVFYLIAKIM
jgi:hypothetical protein